MSRMGRDSQAPRLERFYGSVLSATSHERATTVRAAAYCRYLLIERVDRVDMNADPDARVQWLEEVAVLAAVDDAGELGDGDRRYGDSLPVVREHRHASTRRD